MSKITAALKDPVNSETPTYKDGVGRDDPGIKPRTGQSNDTKQSSSDGGKPYSYGSA